MPHTSSPLAHSPQFRHGLLGETNDSYPCYMNFSILKPDGSSLANTTVCGNSSLNNQTLPTTGTYTVLVNPFANIGGATFTLSQ